MPVSPSTAHRVITSANRLLQHAEGAGWMIIIVRNEYARRDWFGNFFRNAAALEGSPGADIDPRVVVPTSALKLSKSKPDAFSNPALESALKLAAINRLVIIGVMAEGCVRATVKAAARRRYSVTVATDAVGSSRSFLESFGLRNMRRAGAQLSTSAEIP